MLDTIFPLGNPSHLPIKQQSVAALIRDTTWVFTGREGEELQGEMFIAHGLSPGISTHIISSCSRPAGLGVRSHLPKGKHLRKATVTQLVKSK